MASKVLELADFREAAMMQFARDQLVLARAGLDENGDPFNSDSMHAMVRERCKHLANARAQRRAHRRPRTRRR